MKLLRSRILLSVVVLMTLATLVSLFTLSYLWKRDRTFKTLSEYPAFVTTVAGYGAPGFQDGPDLNAVRFADPFGVVIDRNGNLYVSDAGENNRIRKITKDGVVSTLAGAAEGFADGQGTAAAFNSPSGLAIDSRGNLYLADTGNNCIRKITPSGAVTTLAGDGVAGYRDGPSASAEFNGPVGLAIDEEGTVYVADTYNDRIRSISPDGTVRTLAGSGGPGYKDGDAVGVAVFDTPCAVAVSRGKDLLIADTGNNRIRKLTRNGEVVTVAPVVGQGEPPGSWSAPIGIAVTQDNFIFVTESSGGRIKQLSPDGRVRLIAGRGSGFSDGDGLTEARFNKPSGIVVDAKGDLVVADSANYLIRKVARVQHATKGVSNRDNRVLPLLVPELLGISNPLPWPVDPQRQRHEVVATMGEVRGSFQGESRDHFHSGIDIQAPYGDTVRSIYDEKVAGTISDFGFGGINEGMHAGLFSYIHIRVGRDVQNHPLKNSKFVPVRDESQQVIRIRIKRGTRLEVGEPLGTVNRMYHVHLNLGPSGAESNPLFLPFVGFSDHVPPTIERNGIWIFNLDGGHLSAKRNGRLILSGRLRIVVDAYDQVDGNSSRRRLGLYRLGYQVLKVDESPAPGFEQPRITVLFDRLPADNDAVKVTYAEESGITVYGSSVTRFLYEVNNTARNGRVEKMEWNTSELPKGDYILRIIASDLAGNEATTNRDLAVAIE